MNITNEIVKLLEKQDIKKNVSGIFNAFVNIIYNELYIYIWIICFYNVFLFFIVLVNLILLYRMRSFLLYNTRIDIGA
jgi:hypothetical protein